MTTENERRDMILRYVGERQRAGQKTTKATVIRYMKEKRLASRETTHYLINDLINEGKLNKDEINSQVHFLTINENNEFNKIYNTLSKFGKIIDDLNEFNRKIIQQLDEDDRIDLQINSLKEFADMLNVFLLDSLVRINDRVHSDKDREILYKMNIELMLKITKVSQVKGFDQDIEGLIHDLEPLRKKNVANIKYRKFNNSIDNLATIMKNFKKGILPNK